MSFFNSTLTNGIQDISAILPLLGTEQVERHIGSALTGGFLYAAASPISLFGSLGAVKIAFTIAISCTAFRRSHRISWIGAKWLADAGFSATGDVACLIGSPEAYLFGRDVLAKTTDRSDIYLGEEKMSSVINNSHIDNVDKLRIQLKPGLFLWNVGLIFSSFFFAAVGNTPYIYLLRHSNRSPDSIPLWIYPLMRTLGTVLVVVCSQFMIQLRLLQILRGHIIFLSLRKLHDTGKKDKANRAAQILDETTEESNGKTAEDWIYRLKQKLSSPRLVDDLRGVPEDSKKSPDDLRDDLDDLQDALDDQEKKHGMSPSTPTFLLVLGVLTLFGGICTVIGYIGSFTVVQSADNSAGPLVWLATEGGLSLVRIFVWGSNPSFDDNQGFEFILDTSPNTPLITCINSKEEIERDKLLPMRRSDIFLREIASYIGPVESFTHEGISVYYTLTGSAPFKTSNPRVLYVTMYNYKEQASSVIVKIPSLDTSKWEYFRVHDALWDTLHVRIGARISAEENVLTQDVKFLERLREHCQEISVRLNRPKQMSSESIARQDPESQVADPSEYQYTLGSNWSLVLKSSRTEENVTELAKLTHSETKYLEHGSAERAARNFFQRCGWWNEAHMALMRDELLQERPKPTADLLLLGDTLELNEIDHLLIYESLAIESALARQVASQQQSLVTQGQRMITAILQDRKPFKLGNVDEKVVLRRQLEVEATINAANRLKAAKEASVSRLAQQRKSANDRIDSSPENYRSAYNVGTIEHWRMARGERIWEVATEEPPDERPWEVGAEGWLDSYMSKLESDFQSRLSTLQSGNNQAQATQKPEFRLRNNANMALAKARCLARQKAMRHRREVEMDEGLKNVKKQVFADVLVEDGTEEEARERIATMVRLMRSKYTKYLDISNDLIKQAGSLDMLLRIIEYNEVITVITVSVWLPPEDQEKIANVAARMVNVTYCDGQTMKPHLDMGSSMPLTTYEAVEVTDYYRRGNPYLVFSSCGESNCRIRFKATPGSENPGRKILLLSHCGTRASGGLTKIWIILQSLTNTGADGQTVSCRLFSKNLNHDNFVKQYVVIDGITSDESYQLIILLHHHSHPVYWLNSAELVDVEDAYQWCEDNPQLHEDEVEDEDEEGEDDEEGEGDDDDDEENDEEENDEDRNKEDI